MVTYSTQPIAATTAARPPAGLTRRRALQPAHRLVGVDPDDEHVAEGRGLLEAVDVAAVQEIEAPVGEDDPVACAAMPGKAAGQEVNGPDRIKSPFFEPHVSRTTLASLFAARYPANSPAPMSLALRPVAARAPPPGRSLIRAERRWLTTVGGVAMGSQDRMVEIGYTAMCEQTPVKQLVSDLADAEAAGFDFSVMSDHYFPWLEEQGHSGYAGRCSARRRRPPSGCR